MFGRLGVRGKIFAVAAVPILVLLIAAGAVTFAAGRTWDSAKNVDQLLTVAATAAELGDALQNERANSADFVDSYSQANLGRARAENAVDASYLALRAKVAGVSGPQRGAALDALARVDGLLGLKVDANLTTGASTVIVVGGVPVAERTGLYTLRAIAKVENIGDWPTFPTAAQAATQGSDYAQMGRSVLAVSLTAPTAGGVSDTVAEIAANVFEEATQAELATVPGTLVGPVKAAQGATDRQIGAFKDVIAKVSTRTENLPILAVLAKEVNALSGLAEERARVRDRSDIATNVSDWFESVVQPLVSLPEVIAGGITQRPLAHSLSASAAVSQLIDALGLEETLSESLIRQGQFSGQSQVSSLSNTQARTDVALEDAQAAIRLVPGATTLPGYGASYDPVARSSFSTVRFSLAQGDDTVLLGVRDLGTWPTYVQQELDRSYRPAHDALWNRTTSTAQANVRSALLEMLFTALAAAFVVLASLFIALVIARRIVNPLRRLTTTATAVRQELPRLVERVALPGQSVDVSEVQIPVESADEIGRLAEAFNAVNAATLAIAGEQAALRGSISEMFVNVARRDQVLLNRQLASIDAMERTQDDPDTLMRLFALDHLATRMRRNSESLLVLAGIDSGRRMRRPMPLSDVIRTASSEIELYERVELILDADPSMVGHSALTAGHLFAELLENATVFSDPDTKVEVRTTEKDGDFVVEIVDHGIGMTPDELRQASARVVSSAASEILGAQRLGLFVVGRIARRVGARVDLQSEEGKGTTATVILPRSLFDTSTEVERSAPHFVSTVDEKLHVPSALLTRTEDEEVDDFSADVASRAITGERAESAAPGEPAERGKSYEPTESVGAAESSGPETAVSTDDIEELIKADVASAPASEEVDLSALTTGITASGLPTRRRGSKTGTEVKPETTTILGLPERPTTGQLDELARERELEGAFGAPVTERSTAIFRSFRARGSELDAPSAEIPALEADAKVEPIPAKKGAVVEPEIAEGIPALELVPEPTVEAEPAPVAKFKRTPKPEPASPEAAQEPEPRDEVAFEPEVTDNGKADRGETPDESSEDGPGAGLPSGDDHSFATEPLEAKAGDEEGAMAPDWSLGQDPAISNGFGHGNVLTDGDAAFSLADAPLAIPGLEPAVDDASGFGPLEGAAPIPPVYASQEYPELAIPAEAAPAVETLAQGASPFAPVQAPAGSAPALAAVVGSSERPASEPKKRRGLFSRRAKDATPTAPAPQNSASIFAAVTPSPAQVALDRDQESVPEGYEAPAPAYDEPTPGYEAAPAPAYDEPTPGYEAAPAPAYDEPTTAPFGDWTVAPAIPVEADAATPYSIPEIANVDAAAFGEPQAYAVPEYAEPMAQSEPFEVNYDVASYGEPANPDFAAPVGASLEIPTIESAPLDYGHGADQAATPQAAEYPSADFAEGNEAPPAWEEFAAEPPSFEATIPALEADAQLAPMAAPEYPQYGDQPAYPAAESYDAAGQYGEPPAHSSDEFAQPYGWEAAGADALEAAGFERDYRGYSPEAFSAPPPTEDYEVDVAIAVFSELRSLSSERPTIQRTKAGLTRREPSALATAAAPAEVESRAVERDPETVRANFAGFYTGTTRGRADAAALSTDVHGSSNNEVTP